MTIDERFERIEHVTAGSVEERRKDREDNRQLWRDTQRQINEVSIKIIQIGDELRDADLRLGARIEQLAEESRAADKRLAEADKRLGERLEVLGGRIDSLVSAI